MLLDLDHFRVVNDTFGLAVGDDVLQEASRRLEACLRQTDTFARFGCDEFMVILPDLVSSRDAEPVARKMLAALARPFQVGQTECVVSASIGIAVYPFDGDDCTVLLKGADTALACSKERGRNGYHFFMKDMDEESHCRLVMLAHLRRALDRDEEFDLLYQPLVDLGSRRVVGAEALIRWNNPALGAVPPDKFIPVAEDSGLILQLGEWVLRRACDDARRWRAALGARIPIAINVCPAAPPQGLRRELAADSRRGGTEYRGPGAGDHRDRADAGRGRHHRQPGGPDAARLQAVHRRFRNRLLVAELPEALPVHCLKIDRSFVDGLPRDAGDAALVTAVIGMAASFGMETLAEGVERESQIEFLKSLGCDRAQGYYFYRPMSADALLDQLQRLRPTRAPVAAKMLTYAS